MRVFGKCQNLVVFSVDLSGANEISEFSLIEGSSSSMLFLFLVSYRADASLKVVKIGENKLMYVKSLGNV